MNPDPIPIYQGQDFYVPAFEVKVSNQSLRRDVIRDITTVTYKDNIKEIDSFDMTINNWDAQTRDFKYSDSKLFDPGQTIELWMGYFGQNRLRLMLTGEITSLRPSFPSGGQPTLVISGLNVLHRFRKKQESFSYTKKTDSEIAKEIAKRLNVDFDPQAGVQEEQQNLFQDNQYDILFLMERARRNGYSLFIEEAGTQGKASKPRLFFGPSDRVRRVTYTIKYGRSLIDFQPTLTTANQVGQVKVRGWDSVKKQAIEATATRSQLATKGVGSVGRQADIDPAFNQREEVIVNQPVNSKKEAETLAKQTLENIAKDMVKGTGNVVGLPDLRAGNVVFLEGLGQRFSGRYFVTATTHTIGDSGYTTQFECRREEI